VDTLLEFLKFFRSLSVWTPMQKHENQIIVSAVCIPTLERGNEKFSLS